MTTVSRARPVNRQIWRLEVRSAGRERRCGKASACPGAAILLTTVDEVIDWA